MNQLEIDEKRFRNGIEILEHYFYRELILSFYNISWDMYYIIESICYKIDIPEGFNKILIKKVKKICSRMNSMGNELYRNKYNLYLQISPLDKIKNQIS